MAPRRDTWIFIGVSLLLATIIGLASAYVLWLGDDIDYGFFISTSIWDSHGKIDSVVRFFQSQGNHYAFVNGRSVAHALVQLYCGVLGKITFAISNALVYIAFLWLLLKTARGRRAISSPGVIIFAACAILLVFVTKMMPTTQIGFVWMFALNLLWLKLFFSHRTLSSCWTITGLSLLALLAGNGQEALTLPMSAALALWVVHKRFHIGKRWVPLSVYWLGALLICCSPGTLSRANSMHVSLPDTLLYMAISLRATWALLLVLIAVAVLRPRMLRNIYRRNALWFNCLVTALVFNVAVGVYCNRQLFGLELCSLVILLRLIPQKTKYWLVVINIALIAFTALMLRAQFMGMKNVRSQYAEIKTLTERTQGRIVKYNRTLATLNPLMREFRYYEEILGLMSNDTHHSLQKRLHREYPNRKMITVWPIEKDSIPHPCDTIIPYASGHYYIVLLDSTHLIPVAHGHNTLTGAPVHIPVPATRATVKGQNWKGTIVISPLPMMHLDSVTLTSSH